MSKFKQMTDEIMMVIRKNPYHGTTADIWSSRGRSFLGITIHCISKEFKRISMALAVKRLEGRHTAYNIGLKVQQIFEEFSLTRKNHSVTVTDNGSNFVCLYKDSDIDILFDENSDRNDDDLPGEFEVFELSNDPLDIDGDLLVVDTDEEMNWAELKRSLPPRIACSSHTLSLLCTSDLAKKALIIIRIKKRKSKFKEQNICQEL